VGQHEENVETIDNIKKFIQDESGGDYVDDLKLSNDELDI
jgi:hypothetical protein